MHFPATASEDKCEVNSVNLTAPDQFMHQIQLHVHPLTGRVTLISHASDSR